MCIPLTEMNFWHKLRPLMGQFQKPFQHHYKQVSYMIHIISNSQDIWVKDVYKRVCEESITGCTWRPTCKGERP